MIFQDDPAWLNARVGFLTASRMADAMDFKRDGSPSAARIKLMHEILAERLVGDAVSHYVTPAMQHGIDSEPLARERYEALSGNIVQRAGFVTHKTIHFFGATPDGFIDDDGLIEIKCPITSNFIAWKAAGVVPDQHKPQMLAQLACTGRRYVHFIAFDPRLKRHEHQMFTAVFEPTREEISYVEDLAQRFLEETSAMFDKFTQAEAA